MALLALLLLQRAKDCTNIVNISHLATLPLGLPPTCDDKAVNQQSETAHCFIKKHNVSKAVTKSFPGSQSGLAVLLGIPPKTALVTPVA